MKLSIRSPTHSANQHLFEEVLGELTRSLEVMTYITYIPNLEGIPTSPMQKNIWISQTEVRAFTLEITFPQLVSFSGCHSSRKKTAPSS